VSRAESLYFAGKYDSARAVWHLALGNARVQSDSALQAHVMMWLGLSAWRLGDYPNARSFGERALSLKQRLHRDNELSRSYNALGLLARDEGRLADAAALFQNAIQTASKVADTAGINRGAANLALVHLDMGEFAKARQGFLTARAAGRAMGDPRLEGNALNNLAMLTIKLGDPSGAIPMLQEAGGLYASAKYGTGQQNMLGQLATAYDLLGEPQRAFAVLDSAMRLAQAQGLRQEEANNLRLFAELYQGAGDHRRALDYFARAAKLGRELGLQQETGIILRASAHSYAALGRFAQARQNTIEALQLHRSQSAVFEELADDLLLAELAAESRNIPDADAHVRAARTLAAKLDVASARADVALTEARVAEHAGQWRRVIAAVDRAATDVKEARLGSTWEQHSLRARAFARLGVLDSAVAAGRQAVAAAERVRGNIGSGALRTTYVADRAAVYGDLVVTLLRIGRGSEAFEVADAARGRALLEHLATARREISATQNRVIRGEGLLKEIDELTAQLRTAQQVPARERGSADKQRVTELTRRLDRAEAEYEATRARSESDESHGEDLLGVRRTTLRQVQNALAPSEALLHYFVLPDRVLLFIVRRNSSAQLTIPVDESELTGRVRIARELLGKRTSTAADGESVLSALHDLLIEPVLRSGELRGATRLIVVPHGALTYLPFSALRDRASGAYVSDRFSLLHLPSAGALVAVRQRRTTAAAAISKSVILAPYSSALPATQAEAQAIRRTVAGAIVLNGAGASEAALREALASGALVHVATHATLNTDNPLFSRIELATPPAKAIPTNDGRLELHELLGFRVNSALVFLSGCETGVGRAWSTDYARGEDYATLGQAFLFSGARAVIATLWRIDDRGAAEFASRFYRHLRNKAPPEALATAQREMRHARPFEAPYYWAAYQVSGSGERAPLQTRRWNPFN
jgi:CHAT domain-containing protein/tetratricopeptide (TPR) repeat protein